MTATVHVYARRSGDGINITAEWESGATTTKRTRRNYTYLVVECDEEILGKPYVRVLQGTKHRHLALRTARQSSGCIVLAHQPDAPDWWLALPQQDEVTA